MTLQLPSRLNRLAGTVLLGGTLLVAGVAAGAEVARADVSLSPVCEFVYVHACFDCPCVDLEIAPPNHVMFMTSADGSRSEVKRTTSVLYSCAFR